jgi:hypothetical protein
MKLYKASIQLTVEFYSENSDDLEQKAKDAVWDLECGQCIEGIRFIEEVNEFMDDYELEDQGTEL